MNNTYPPAPAPNSPYRNLRFWIALLLCAALVVAAGCSKTPRVKKRTVKIKVPKYESGPLTNKVLFIPYRDATTREGGFDINQFNRVFLDAMGRECKKKVQILTQRDPAVADLVVRLSEKLEMRDIVGFVNEAKSMGVSAIATGLLTDVESDERKRGFWWFADSSYYLQFQVDAFVYDIETGAKRVDEHLMREVEIDGLEFDSLNIGQSGDYTVVERLMTSLAKDAADRSCKALRKHHFISYIVSAENGLVVLPSGTESGIFRGQVLDVYNSGALFEGKRGQRYFIPGLKTGTVKVTRSSAGRAEATIVSGDDIQAGYSVRITDKGLFRKKNADTPSAVSDTN